MGAEKACFPVKLMARLPGVSRSGLYDRARREPPEDPWAEARAAAGRCWLESGRRFGARSVRAVLASRGMGLALYRARRLMRELGIRGVVPNARKRATVPGPGAPARPDLVRRDFEPPAPTTALCGDIAYLRTGQGWLCLATAIDLRTRMVVGWSLSERMTADIAASALETAKGRGYVAGNAIFHSDSKNAVSRLCGRATKPASCKPGPHRSTLARTPIEGPNASAAWPAQRSAPCHAPDLPAARGGPDGGPRLPGP